VDDPSRFKGDNRPVEQVSWEDAVEFCDRLSQHTKREYRLPSEAEWEYACRARTTTPFHFGETIATDLANYRGTDREYEGKTYLGFYGAGSRGEYREKTMDVGIFPANAFGLYDMHGNVWEWCADHYHANYEGAPTDGSAWISEEKSLKHLLRGGSWFSYPRNCRSAVRNGDTPDIRFNSFGFRIFCLAARTE
jgi:formylglycine-generating enzyme required for sulfatase activity